MPPPGYIASQAESVPKVPVVDETTRLLPSNDTTVEAEGNMTAHAKVDLETQLSLDGASHSHEDPVGIQACQQREEPRQTQEAEQTSRQHVSIYARYSKAKVQLILLGHITSQANLY